MGQDKAQKLGFHFEGIDAPNTTPMPDVYFDVVMPQLKEAEIRVLLYIVRRTFGFKKSSDSISFNQFLKGITTKDGRILDGGCGLKSRSHLSRALKSLEDKGVIVSGKSWDERGENQTTIYGLRFKQGVVPERHHHSAPTVLPVVPERHSQETVKQETVKQETEEDLSRPRKAYPPQKFDEARLTLVDYIADLSAEFLDTASVESSTTRAVNLYRKSGLSLDAFIEQMTEARAVTKERMFSIKKRTREGDKTRMAYFFSILEDRIGLRNRGST